MSNFDPGLDNDFDPRVDNPDVLGSDPTPADSEYPQAVTNRFATITIPLKYPDQPTRLLSLDPSRVRALVRASVPNVRIGEFDVLATYGPLNLVPVGYEVPTTSGDELTTTDDVFVTYAPLTADTVTAYVTVFIERYVTE